MSTSVADDLSTVSFARTRASPDYSFINDSPETQAAYRRVMGSLSALKEGDIDPWMGLKIYRIIRKSTRFIVYLDERCDVQWWWITRPNEGLVSRVQSRLGQLTKESAFLLIDPEQTDDVVIAEKIRRVMGEAMALALNDAPLEDCEAALAEARRYITVSKDQRTRPLFLLFFLSIVALLGVILGLWVCFGGRCCAAYDAKFVSAWLEGAVAGSAGAMISAMLRTVDLGLEPAARWKGLLIEAAARALIGAGTGILIVLAYESGILIKDILRNDSHVQHAVRLFLCIASGVSERILPSLVGKAEDLINGNGRSRASSPDPGTKRPDTSGPRTSPGGGTASQATTDSTKGTAPRVDETQAPASGGPTVGRGEAPIAPEHEPESGAD
jgi:hypothetical protein